MSMQWGAATAAVHTFAIVWVRYAPGSGRPVVSPYCPDPRQWISEGCRGIKPLHEQTGLVELGGGGGVSCALVCLFLRLTSCRRCVVCVYVWREGVCVWGGYCLRLCSSSVQSRYSIDSSWAADSFRSDFIFARFDQNSSAPFTLRHLHPVKSCVLKFMYSATINSEKVTVISSGTAVNY